MKSRIAFGIALILVAGLFLVVSKNKSAAPLNGRLKVATSFYPLYFFTSEIAGDRAEVYNVTPAGAEPHDYDPTTGDLAAIESSKLLILNGGKLEAWGDRIQNILKGTSTKVAVVGEALATGEVKEDSVTGRDPHVWLDPPLARQEAAAIAAALSQVDPGNAGYYEANAAALESKLDNLDKKFRDTLATCAQKEIITSHAAFGYLAKDYGLQQLPIAGLSPDAEPSPATMAAITDFARAHHVKYIFFESLVSPRLADTIASEIGAQTLVLNPLEGLSDAETKTGKNYLSVMQDNLDNLKQALTCQTP